MKILIVITKSEMGGAQVFALNLARELKALGQEVVVGGGPGDFLPKELKKLGLSFYRFKNLKRGFSLLHNLLFLRELKKYVNLENFEAVHLNSTNALLGAWPLRYLQKKNGAKKPKIIFSVHGLSLIDSGHEARALIKKFYRFFFKLAFEKLDEIVFVSRLNKDFALRTNLIKTSSEKKASLIYNGLDICQHYFISREIARKFLEKVLQEKLGSFEGGEIFGSNSFIYGSIGRLAYPKNYEFLITNHREVLKFNPRAYLIIIGEGPERGKYESLIKTYGLEKSVFLLGEINGASHYLQAFDLFVLPSVFEGLSLSLIEAKISGISVLASRVGGNEEVLGEAFCFNLNDSLAYLDKVKEVIEKVALEPENSLREGGEESSSSKFSARKMAEKYLELYLR
ncbi:glycosyltransferase [Patescibacteria group bacterium]|nr:glycosyltransferase [Patescibacteria group bacterium]